MSTLATAEIGTGQGGAPDLLESVEIRVPGPSWCKLVRAVKEKAKTGYDWDAKFLQVGRVADVPPGSLLCSGNNNAGSRKHPCKDVDLHVVGLNGGLTYLDGVRSNEWAFQLRELACAWLALDPLARMLKAAEEHLAQLGQEQPAAQERYDDLKAVIEAGERGEWPPGQTNWRGCSTVELMLEEARRGLASIEPILAAERQELETQLRIWQEEVEQLRALDARRLAAEEAASMPLFRADEPDPRLAGISDEDLLAEVRRRGLTGVTA